MNFVKTFLDAIMLGIGLTVGYFIVSIVIGAGIIGLLKVTF